MERKLIRLQLTILTYFIKIDKKLVKNTENVNKNSWITSNIHKTLSLDNSLWEAKIQNIVLIPYSTLEGPFNDTNNNSTMIISIGQNCLEKKVGRNNKVL